MKKNIIITGGLGYIGTELCRIYSGVSWNNEITVIDSSFSSERVSQLRNWGINYLEADIREVEKIREYIQRADIIHHLAGITDVPRVKKESATDKDNLIIDTAVTGTQNILDNMKEDAKIIFPSTHVIFEGLSFVKKNINEKEKPIPLLSYGISKKDNEDQIIKSKKKYIILRLGSVYGYSNDSTRLNIMANFFAKITSQNKSINLFAGGKQLKSLVPLIDVARCFKFMEERDDLIFQTYNLAKDSVTVKEVALICKKYNKNLQISSTDDEIPNLGFTLDNKKILNTGFKFLYNLEESIKEMIEKWSNRDNQNLLEYVKKGEKEFIDTRGKISNHELPEPINLIGLINSKTGTIRANHYHPIQEQKCLLTKGQFISVYQDLLNNNSSKITHVVNEGDLIVTKPNVAHAMVFTKDSVFLNLVRGEREHENYGVTHTIKHVLVEEKEKDMLMKIYKLDCRSCGNINLKRVISLGYQPLANNLLKDKKSKFKTYPLEMNFCPKCFNCQLSVAVDPKEMFSHYLYTSSTSESFKNHFKTAAEKYIKKFKLKPNKSYIVDIGSNDGVALKPFKDLKFKNLLGIEPAKNLANISNKRGIKTINAFLEKKILKKIKKNASIVLASNVFAHSDKLKEMAECMLSIVAEKGIIIIEVQYLVNTLKDLTFDNIYHEHYNYWSLTSLINFFNNFNVKIFKVEKINTHGGSIRIYISKNKKIKIEKSVTDIINEELKFGIKNFETYKKFAEKIYTIKDNVVKNIKKLKKEKKNIIGFGAPAKATTFLNFLNISKEIDFIIEDNKLKHNMFLPGMMIPIKDKSHLKNNNHTILVLAWNFFEEIKKNNSNLGKEFINIKNLEK